MDDELLGHLHASGLTRIADQLLSRSLSGIHLSHRAVNEETLAIGISKIGGTPDLPHGVQWPQWDGQPLAFLAQIRLAEVIPYDVDAVLPTSGLLSFFFSGGAIADRDPASWAVLYFEESVLSLVRSQPPSTLPADRRFTASAINFSITRMLPSLYSGHIQSLGLTDEEATAYRRVYNEVSMAARYDQQEEPMHQLLGYPFDLEPDALLDAYRAYSEWYDDNPPPQEDWSTDAMHWRLLLQIDSDAETGMDWGGGGLVYYCIEDDALRARAFNDTWLTMQFL